MHPYWFFIGNFPIRAYGTILVLAFILAVGVTLYFLKAEQKAQYIDPILDLAPWLLIGAVIGARFWQVFFFDWAYYSRNLGEIVAVWHGGLSIQGGVAGALIVAIIYIRQKKLPFWELADFAAPGLILGQGIGRDANLLNGDAFGGPTGGNFGIVYPSESIAASVYGTQPLWPAEIWEGQIDIILFAILLMLRLRRWPQGFIFLFYVMSYNSVRIFLEMLRGDSPRFLFNWTAAQWSSVCFVLIAAVLMVWIFIRDHKKTAESPP
ncbi:MAG: prolipoprotein diacylglyceryl transferase [Peptococcaceae bacterium]|jgi:phosphatidylglycerol:prolipoprotein diacylglycerol transferase|nr:prolipoprotein diacylglyceryl transferase [Peptococcaceae bacterium]